MPDWILLCVSGGLLLGSLGLGLGLVLPGVVEYVIHYYHHSNHADRVASLRRYIRVVCTEIVGKAFIAALYPLGWLPRPVFKFDPDKGPLIVLVHGYGMNRSSMWLLAWRLRVAGYRNVISLNLWPLLGNLETIGTDLKQNLEALSKRHDTPLTIIAHSMGGLAVRWALSHSDQIKQERWMTLGTPHQGTRMAVLGLGANARQMRPGSSFLTELNQHETVPDCSIYSGMDAIIIPPESSVIGSDVVRFEHMGHNGLLFSASVFESLAQRLPAINQVDAGPGALLQSES